MQRNRGWSHDRMPAPRLGFAPRLVFLSLIWMLELFPGSRAERVMVSEVGP